MFLNTVENLGSFIFHHNDKKRKPAEATVPVIRRAGDEHREVEGGSSDADDDGEVDRLSGVSDGESAGCWGLRWIFPNSGIGACTGSF